MEASVGSKDRHFRMTDPATTLMCGPGEDPRDMTPIVGTSLTCRDVYPVTVEGTCEEDHKLRAVWTKRSGGLCSWSPQEQPRQTAKCKRSVNGIASNDKVSHGLQKASESRIGMD
ncbi:hypothetical protein E5Q_02997 [Mixia osmundae IAM 14324]|uniref:Uncharacterized protein n=1 Tax=Mixia osmundae (strain CBS 9802 / IAM 14324 / JCM 22182 / KY 12970) TaxID=764103 RepID=G7E0H1_MIXOS|nr:hypothetical protein E5Q_02997 [Mixia osmundae IAM 14324]